MRQFKQEDDQTFKLLMLCVILTAIILYVFLIRKENVLGDVANEPVVVSEHLPDFSEYTVVRDRKEAFFAFLKPLIERVNSEIAEHRAEVSKLFDIYQQKESLSKRQWQKVYTFAKMYRIDDYQQAPKDQLFDILLRRVAPIPQSLVLAQAANESAWGRSRFALEGNNLFGQWCFKKGCGLIPNDRPEGKSYEVAVFKKPIDSVRSYVMNLNTFDAYRELREKRLELIESDKPVTGYELAEGLINYSTRREAYVEEIRLMIEQNHLEN
ncbi:glucosaminidase domain-containing protein [Pleionea litopenaei]|uniref:Glucosaminidase domain-containing protein n=1 Tax=Pleionea litopenaei TaxID=3070815 RepID=A0AA51RWB4_9GAMM|nr:glucosaminidase domain-containing protein [Pleionea sp. HL-JVS1]WMS88649.1 glucosaminidase domain-containing protein [Pleionea sp. HL-JVS1]